MSSHTQALARSLSSFDGVAAHYASIKPVISVAHDRSDDIRPIAQRRYKAERIIKVDENTYALSDGYYDEAMYKRGYSYEFFIANAPIVWTRKPDGDYVRIRNGAGKNAHMSRYQFLRTYVPFGMSFGIDQGKQYIHLHPLNNAPVLLLPKSAYTWDWSTKSPTCDDDHMYLTFKVLGGGKYERVGELLAVKTKRIDRDLRKKYKAHINEFYDWFSTMYDMLPCLSWSETSEHRVTIGTWIHGLDPKATYTPHYAMFDTDNEHNIAFVRSVLEDTEHPMRVTLAALLKYEYGVGATVTSIHAARQLRTKYIKIMNKLVNVFKVQLF